MPASIRRPHTKSRHGCQQCKKNRTKCDEKKPSCSRCMRTGATCSLLDPSSALIIINDPSTKSRKTLQERTQASPTVSTAPSETETAANLQQNKKRFNNESPAYLAPDFQSVSSEKHSNHMTSPVETEAISTDLQISKSEVARMELMYHYHRHACPSIVALTMATKAGQSIWETSVPELAFRHDYLLHGLLSVSALHQALSQPSTQRRNGIIAVEQYGYALALFTPHLAQVTAENIDNLFAFACLTALYSFGIHLRGQYQLSPLVKIHEVFNMLRGTGMIVGRGQHWLEQGIWAAWFCDMKEDPNPNLPIEIENVLDLLASRIASTITTSSQDDMYVATIQALRKNFQQAQLHTRTHRALVTFPIFAPPDFLQMVCIGEPLALAILANWAVALHRMRRHIWVQDWGAQTVKAVHEVLPPEWQDCIAWAMKEVENTQTPTGLPTPNEEGGTPSGLQVV